MCHCSFLLSISSSLADFLLSIVNIVTIHLRLCGAPVVEFVHITGWTVLSGECTVCMMNHQAELIVVSIRLHVRYWVAKFDVTPR